MSHVELVKTTLENGATLAYRLSHPIDRSLPTMVMLHSFLMDSRLYGKQFEDPRYGVYNLIAIDEHGHGGTTGRDTDFTFWDTASDSLELLTKLGIERFYVLGTSQGGFIGLRMALLALQRLRGLILLGTSPSKVKEENKINARALRDKWCATPRPSEEVLLAKAVSFGGPERVGEKTYEKVKQMWLERYLGPQGYNPALDCLLNLDSVEERLAEIQTPVLVIHGTDDTFYPAENVGHWVAKLPNVWKLEIVERGTHYLSFTEPGDEVCAQLVPQFIKDTL